MHITHRHLEKYTEAMLTQICEVVGGNDLSPYRERFEEHKKEIPLASFQFCLVNFLQAEFDYKTSGSRGLGRISEEVPRLGAYFRNGISKLNSEEMKELDSRITMLIVKFLLCSYPLL